MIASLSLAIWVFLVFGRGRFWRSSPELSAGVPPQFPEVDIIVPARDEAQSIAAAIGSLLCQDYGGKFRVILVDDNSTDRTAELAGAAPNLSVLRLRSKPPAWSGKLWALNQGIAAGDAPLLLLTDADIVHDPRHLSALVTHLLQAHLDLVSEMVRLNCSSLAERALVPAFVYFFQMLYPFAKVNDPHSSIAAAAGGSILIRRESLERIGGIEAIKSALIDDVALAAAVKPGGGIFLGHSALAASVRRYPGFLDIWRMISRTAFTQLRLSATWLALTVAGLTLLWFVPVWGIIFGHGFWQMCAAAACGLAAASYLPTLSRYQQSRLWVMALPLIALFYLSATVGSALNFWGGKGASWKDRNYVA